MSSAEISLDGVETNAELKLEVRIPVMLSLRASEKKVGASTDE